MTGAKLKYPKMSAARLKMLNEPGHIYAAYSRYCDWIKLGFTTKLDQRLENLEHQYAEFAPFSLIGVTVSTHRAEQQLHRALAAFRQGQTGRTKELYPAVRPMVQTVKNLVSWREWKPMSADRWIGLRRWAWAESKQPFNRVEALLAFDRYYAENGIPRHGFMLRHPERRAA